MLMLAILIITGLCLAFANGANDNFKGVATLFGSATTNYRRALLWATACTLLGSLTAVMLAGELLRKFSGKGLVDEALTANVDYAAAVACGAAATVFIATRLGMPVSTTHGLLGALLGAGMAAGSAVSLSQLGTGFLLPLLLSPLLAMLATGAVYPLLHRIRKKLGITADTCLCVGREVVEIMPLGQTVAALQRARELSVRYGDTVTCRHRYQGDVLGLQAGPVLDWMHYGSAGVLSFARGLNDTPKIAALLLLSPLLTGTFANLMVGVLIACGGLLLGRRVAETMSHRLTAMNHGQGFVANLLSGIIVIGASRLGLPVSTTHVSCGALIGVGTVTRQSKWSMIGKVAGAWLLTLPMGAALGAVSMWALRWFA